MNPVDLKKKIGQLEFETGKHRDAGELLKVQGAYLELLLDSAPEAILLADNQQRVTRVNAQFSKMFGFSREEIVGSRADDLIVPKEKRKEASGITNRVARGSQVRFESSRSRKDGTLVYVEGMASPVLVRDEQVGAFVSYRDITDRKRSEDALREAEERYRSLFESSPVGIGIATGDGRLLDYNEAILKPGGYRQADIQGLKTISDLYFDPQERERIIRTARSQGFIDNCEVRFKRKDGTPYVALLSLRPMKIRGEPCWHAIVQDVTEHKRAEEEKRNLQTQLFHAQKMEAIGTLAGGIAHDFNNLLMGIQGRVSLMMLECDPGHAFHGHLQGIQEHVESAADLTKQLLGFARGGKYEVKPTDLNSILRKSCEMFGRTKKEISIHSKYQEQIWTVEVDRGQIEQVFINLFVNAWQSMPGGGNLFVETENISICGAASKPYGLRDGRYVKTSITDTGIGMDERTMERIFDPFFTTKEMGRGTGMGLASAYGIIKNHGGMIQVESRVGEGSAFAVYLPASEKEVVLQHPGREEMMRGNETVLFVDDEEMILEVGIRMLVALGYNTLTARNGEEALALYLEKSKSIHLVILDMIMPGMSGKETFEQLKKIDPQVRVLLSSGYSMDSRAKEILDGGCRGFIQKPFTLASFSKKLREVLES